MNRKTSELSKDEFENWDGTKQIKPTVKAEQEQQLSQYQAMCDCCFVFKAEPQWEQKFERFLCTKSGTMQDIWYIETNKQTNKGYRQKTP